MGLCLSLSGDLRFVYGMSDAGWRSEEVTDVMEGYLDDVWKFPPARWMLFRGQYQGTYEDATNEQARVEYSLGNSACHVSTDTYALRCPRLNDACGGWAGSGGTEHRFTLKMQNYCCMIELG